MPRCPLAVLDGTMVVAPSELPSDPPENAPDGLRVVWDLVLQWGESDGLGWCRNNQLNAGQATRSSAVDRPNAPTGAVLKSSRAVGAA
jgi:hypothetical protein